MFKFIKQKLNKNRQEKSLQKYLKSVFEPRKEFLENGQNLFLNEVAKKHGTSFRQPIKIGTPNLVFRYIVGVVAILLFTASSASVYANQTDVDSESPLYPFKKISEDIQLTLTPKEKKVELYEKFAERRVKEINALVAKKSKKDSGEIKIIKEKLKEDFKNKINKIEEQDSDNEEKTIIIENNATSSKQEIKNNNSHLKLCNINFVNIENGEGELFWKKSEKLEKFKERCDKIREIKADKNENSTSTNSFENKRNNKEKEVED